MATPKEVLKVIKKEAVKGTHKRFLEYLDTSSGSPVLRTYIFRHNKGDRRYRYHEILRTYQDGSQKCLASLYYSSMQGYNIVWDKGYFRQGVFENLEYRDYFVNTRRELHITSEYTLYRADDIMRFYKNKIPYFFIDDGIVDLYDQPWNKRDIFQYVRKYQEHKETELFAKQGLGFLTIDNRLYKLSDRSKKKLLSFIKTNKEEVLRRKLSLNSIIKCIKNGYTAKEYSIIEAMETLNREIRDATGLKGMKKELVNSISKYLSKKSITSDTYHRYCFLLKNYDLELSNRNLMPRDFQASYEALDERYREYLERMDNEEREREEKEDLKLAKENASRDTKVAAVAKAIALENGKTFGGYTVFVPMSFSDFNTIAKALHNCVARMGYDKKVAEGKSVIFALMKGGKFITCNEVGIAKNNEVSLLQSYTDELEGMAMSQATQDERDAAIEFMSTINPKAIKKALRNA